MISFTIQVWPNSYFNTQIQGYLPGVAQQPATSDFLLVKSYNENRVIEHVLVGIAVTRNHLYSSDSLLIQQLTVVGYYQRACMILLFDKAVDVI